MIQPVTNPDQPVVDPPAGCGQDRSDVDSWTFIPDVAEKLYRAVNDDLKSGTKGLAFRRATNEVKADNLGFVRWDAIVLGTRINDEWVRVNAGTEDRFLPVYLNGVQVLRPVEERTSMFKLAAPQFPGPTPSVWRYQPENGKRVDIRAEPRLDGPRTQAMLSPGDCFTVSTEVLGEDGVLFMKLADGRGWLFDRVPGARFCERAETDSGGTKGVKAIWRYRPYNGKAADLREEPSVNGKRSSVHINPEDIFEVSEELPGDASVLYLRVASIAGKVLDGTDFWLFDNRPSARMCTRADEDSDWVHLDPAQVSC